MNWGNLNDICKEHELVLLDTSSLRFHVSDEEMENYSERQLNHLHIEYAKFIRNALKNNKNLKTIPAVIDEISCGLGNKNFKGNNIKLYKDACREIFWSLKDRVVEEPEYYADAVKIVNNIKNGYRLSGADCDLIALLISSDKKIACVSNDFLLSYAAFEIGKPISNNFNLYYFNKEEFAKIDREYLINNKKF